MRFWTGIGIFIAVIVVAFTLFVLHITGSPHEAVPVAAPAFAPITDVTVSDSYSSKTGLHTVKGSGTVPTACTSLTASSTVVAAADASSTATIRIDLSAPTDTGMCLELPTKKTFTFSIKAAKDAGVTVYANGALATSTDQ